MIIVTSSRFFHDSLVCLKLTIPVGDHFFYFNKALLFGFILAQDDRIANFFRETAHISQTGFKDSASLRKHLFP